MEEEQIKPLTSEELELKLLKTAKKINYFDNNRLETTRRLSTIQHLIDEMKIKKMSEIAAERDEEGRKTFPNQDARDAEVMRRVSKIPAYEDLKKKEDDTKQELEEVILNIQEEDRIFKALKAIAYMRGGK